MGPSQTSFSLCSAHQFDLAPSPIFLLGASDSDFAPAGEGLAFEWVCVTAQSFSCPPGNAVAQLCSGSQAQVIELSLVQSFHCILAFSRAQGRKKL